jgi:cardiolipin synthase A/B
MVQRARVSANHPRGVTRAAGADASIAHVTGNRASAEELLRAPVTVGDLALTFGETTAATAEVHVGGPSFFPLILRDVAAASTSVHVNQFGFKPGTIGEAFADALLAKAAEGVAVRVVVDGQGSRPDGGSRELYRRLLAGGVDVRVVRATRLRGPTQPRAAGGGSRWNLDRLARIDHRKLFAIDGKIGWVGGGGIEDHFNDGRFLDLFVRLTGPVVSQLQLVFLASFRWLGGAIPARELDALFPDHEAVAGAIPATVLHNAPGPRRPITAAIARLLDGARETLDVVNPYVADRAMVGRIEAAARRGVAVRLFVPGKPNNLLCGFAQRHHHAALLDAGVRILDHPAMLHAKAFVSDREEVLAGTCNLDAWSLARSFELDVRVRSPAVAAQFDERFSAPAEAISTPGTAPAGRGVRLVSTAAAAISPLL